jgi:murein DD-endopeptidase MepM/ murein hydrolase activator NlpD
MLKSALITHRTVRTAAVLAFAALVAGCGGNGTPAPVELGGAPVAPSTMPYAPTAAPTPMPSPPYAPRPASVPLAAMPAAPAVERPRQELNIVVRPGQSVGGLAEQYHVSRHDIIAANHLPPPYGIEIGQHLVIPGVIPGVTPGAGGRAEAAAAPPPERHAAAAATPEVIPLDAPAPAKAPAPTVAPPPRPSAAAAPEREAANTSTKPAATETAAPRAGLLWPVQGRIIAGYGEAAGGRRNDGINIGAPLGAPIRAVDGGVVAYAGNEVRGYGNLVLVKHPDGFISAYAHCEKLLVRKGERVARGQVIAKVGATGGVAAPQLHFELRRGEQAVDPRQFLAPPSSAQGAAKQAG